MQQLSVFLYISFVMEVLPTIAFQCQQYSAELDGVKNAQRQLQRTLDLFMQATPGLPARLKRLIGRPHLSLTTNSEPQEFQAATIQTVSLLKAYKNEHVKKTCGVPSLIRSLEQPTLDTKLDVSMSTCYSVREAIYWTKDYGCAPFRGRIAGRAMTETLPAFKMLLDYLQQLLKMYERSLTTRQCSESS